MVLSWIFFSLSKFRGISVLWKKAVFSCFPWPHRKKIQRIFIRTILKFDDLPIAHFETDVPLFSKHMLEIAIPLKFWVPAHSKVSWSRTMTAKMSVFRPLFLEKIIVLTHSDPMNPPKCYTWLESYGSPLSDGKKKKIFSKSYKPSEFC